MLDNKGLNNINDLDDNIPEADDLSDRANMLSEDITAKIDNLSKELDSILLDIEKTKNKPINNEKIELDPSIINPTVSIRDIDIEALINSENTPQPIDETTSKPIIEDPIITDNRLNKEEIKEKTKTISLVHEHVDDKNTKDVVSHLNDILNMDKKDDMKKEVVNKKQEIKKDIKKTEVVNKAPIKKEEVKLSPSNNGNGDNNNDKGKKKKKKVKKGGRPYAHPVTFFFAMLITIFIFLGLVAGAGCLYFTRNMLRSTPEFSPAKLDSADSTIIYDSQGNQVIELGLYLRENIEYEELPNCVIDAFVSIEDSRFFEHFGFDIPRFTKAILENLRSMSFGQGGSTLTMQLVKLSYFQVDDGEESTMASRSGMSGVQRKMQEIALALQAEQRLSKEEIITLYLNKVNFGDNIRGIQKASEYYFGKDANQLTLNEAAFLAGIVNAPNGNNPYNGVYDIEYLNNANDRKNEVLDLMAYHGYITENEANLNKAVKVENLVTGKNAKFGETNTYYQSFIDAVINEAYKVTGKNPYTTAMNIYTSMDPYMQEYLYNMQNHPELFEDKYVFRHDDQQNALVVMNNQTGELVALGGGRNQADEARQFNRAVDSYINPGSSIKPVLEYCLAFDRLGYATSHTICDKPVFLYETDIVVANAYGQGYTGDMQITEALARSLNTPAIQLMYDLFDYYEDDPRYEDPEDAIIEYCQSIGLDSCNKNTFDVQWAIGGRDCLVSPVQLAGAHGMLIHGGKYITPHTIKRIEYRGKYNETPDFIADTEGKQVVSPAAAYMTAYLEKNNVDSGWIPQLNLLRRDYSTFAKTGTTNFSEAAYVNYDIPETAAKDQWLVTQTSNYTVVVWNGFDKLADGAYFTVTDENYNLKCKMGSIILDAIMEHYNYDAKDIEQPDDCIKIDHLLGCFPYAKGNNAHGLISINSPYATPINESEIEKEVVGGRLYHMGAKETAEGLLVHWDEFNSYTEDGRVDTTITSVSGNTTVFASGRSYYQRYNFANPGMFYASISAASGEEFSVESATPTTLVEVAGEGPFTVCGWTDSNPNPVCGSSRNKKESSVN